MAKKFNESGIAIIEMRIGLALESFDLDNCKDVFGRCLGEQMDFQAIEDRFNELWQSSEVVTVDEFKEGVWE